MNLKILFQISCLFVNLMLSLSDIHDKTLQEGEYGGEVVDAVYNKIRESCIFPDDSLFLRRLAYVETQDGNDPNKYSQGYEGGIWKIDQAMFNRIKNSKDLKYLTPEIKKIFHIDWTQVKWSDLKIPLYSGLAAALYLSTIREKVPGLIENQGSFYSKYFRVNAHAAHSYYLGAKSLDNVCHRTNIDLAFLVDASGSVHPEDFNNSKRFARDVISNFKIGPADVRVAFVTFSTGYRSEFNFSDYPSKEKVLTAVNGIVKVTGGTETDVALKFAYENLFTSANGSRNGTSKVILLITDGKSDASYRTVAEAIMVRKKGIIIFTIGVGRQVDRQELLHVASPPSCTHVLQLDDFSDLNSLVSEIQQVSCKAPAVLASGTYTYPCSKDGLYEIESNGTMVQVTIHVSDGSVDIYGSLTNPTPNIADNSFHTTSSSSASAVTLMIDENMPVFFNVTPSNCLGSYTIKVGRVERVKPNTQVTCVEKEVSTRCSPAEIYKLLYQFLKPPYNIPNLCVKGRPMFKLDSTNQTRFLYCGPEGTMFLYVCPQHHIYNDDIKDCVLGEPSTTTTSTTTTTTIPTTTITTTSTTTTTTTIPKVTAEMNPCTDENLRNEQFYFPYPPDPTKYIECSNWHVAFLKQCDVGKIWNQFHRTCRYKNVIIDPTKKIFELIPNPCRNDLKLGDLFYYPHPLDSQKYIHCDQFGNAFEKTCPDGKIWNQELLLCIRGGILIG